MSPAIPSSPAPTYSPRGRMLKVCIRFAADDYVVLARAAQLRRCSPEGLLDRLVKAAIGAELVDAILDDDVEA